MTTPHQQPRAEREAAELETLLAELVSEARDVERYAVWDRHARAETESRQGVEEAQAKIRALLTTLRAEQARDREDTARLDWLGRGENIARVYLTSMCEAPSCFGADRGPSMPPTYHSTLREAIDAARSVSLSTENGNGE